MNPRFAVLGDIALKLTRSQNHSDGEGYCTRCLDFQEWVET